MSYNNWLSAYYVSKFINTSRNSANKPIPLAMGSSIMIRQLGKLMPGVTPCQLACCSAGQSLQAGGSQREAESAEGGQEWRDVGELDVEYQGGGGDQQSSGLRGGGLAH